MTVYGKGTTARGGCEMTGKTRDELIRRFLINAEAQREACRTASSRTVLTLHGMEEFQIPEEDRPYLEMLRDLPVWHPFPGEKPRNALTAIVTVRNINDTKRWNVQARWLTDVRQMSYINAEYYWQGPGFYRDDGTCEYLEDGVVAWMPEPEPYTEGAGK